MSPDNAPKTWRLDRAYTVGNLLTLIAVCLAVGTAWSNLDQRVAINANDIQHLKGTDALMRLELQRLNDKMDQALTLLAQKQ